MLLTVMIILFLTLLVYGLWDWLWHIATSFVLALILYLAWPWLSQMRWDDALIARLQQVHLPPVSAASTRPIEPVAVLPQTADGSRAHFEGLSQAKYPRPSPQPALCAEDLAGNDVFLWKGKRWYLAHSDKPYKYLCVPDKKLAWCWPMPPDASAVPCRNDSGDGWCWRSAVNYGDDSHHRFAEIQSSDD